jgi:hypothetical protein
MKSSISGPIVLGLLGLWVILQTTRGPLAQKLGFHS